VHELYGADDREERHPVVESLAERARRLADMLAEYLRRYGPLDGAGGAEAELDADTLADLRALGYLDGD